ncbi:hypothetical protein cypCar_00000176, partial [Cyprinus carpio]
KLKPVVKKKRRDRIDHNLEALRDLLFKNTTDTCLQNPKMEKAEILDLAVQYIKKTTRKTEVTSLIYLMFFSLSAVTSNQMDSKATPNQSVVSATVGPTSDLYVSDFYWRFKSFEQKEVLLKLRVNLTSASKAVNEPVAQKGLPTITIRPELPPGTSLTPSIIFVWL